MSYDLHVHSNVSDDCTAPMEESVQRAIALGLDGLCFTDHLNLIIPQTSDQPDPNGFLDWQKSYEKIQKVRESYGSRLEILHGMELAELTLDEERGRSFLTAPGIDYLLCAAHMARGFPDFYWMTFPDLAFCKHIMALYLDENIRLAKLQLADVLAHIGYPNRYMIHQGFSVDIMDYEGQLRQLFTLMVQSGQGLELNTSGLRQGADMTFPHLPALKLYRACGGEIVTIGSDAHKAKDVGSHIKDGEELLRQAGFRYTTIFRQRKPHFIKL